MSKNSRKTHNSNNVEIDKFVNVILNELDNLSEDDIRKFNNKISLQEFETNNKDVSTHRSFIRDDSGKFYCQMYECTSNEYIIELIKILRENYKKEFNIISYPPSNKAIYGFIDIDSDKLKEDTIENRDRIVKEIIGCINIKDFEYTIARKSKNNNLHIYTNILTCIEEWKVYIERIKSLASAKIVKGKYYDNYMGEMREGNGWITYDEYNKVFDNVSGLYSLYSNKIKKETGEVVYDYYRVDKEEYDIEEITKYDIYNNAFGNQVYVIDFENYRDIRNQIQINKRVNEYGINNIDVNEYKNILIDAEDSARLLRKKRFQGKKWLFWLTICKSAGVSYSTFDKLSQRIRSEYNSINNKRIWNDTKTIDKRKSEIYLYKISLGDRRYNIKELVSMEFPEQVIEYTEVSDELYLCKFPHDKKTIIVKAPLGSGKTKQQLTYIEEEINTNPNVKILVITFRVNLALKYKKELEDKNLGFKYYEELGSRIYTNRVICQVESLHKLQMKDFDIVICDEWKSIHTQLFSPTMTQRASLQIFEYAIINSKKGIFMDGHITNRDIRNIKMFRDDPHIIWNRHIRERKPCILYQDYYMIKKNIIEALQSNQKIAICWTAGLNKLDALENQIAEMFPNKVILKYTSKDGNRKDFENVNESWKTCDALIYSPAVAAGISYELPDFNKIFGIFTAETCGPEQAVQMLRRVRIFDSCGIYIKQTYKGCNITKDQYTQMIQENIDAFDNKAEILNNAICRLLRNNKCEIIRNNLYELWVDNEVMKLKNKKYFAYNMIKLMKRSGYVFSLKEFEKEDMETKKESNTTDKYHLEMVNDKHAKLIVSVPIVTKIKYEELKMKKTHDTLNDKEQAKIDKYILYHTYDGKYNDFKIDEHFIKNYYNTDVRYRYNNLKMIRNMTIEEIDKEYSKETITKEYMQDLYIDIYPKIKQVNWIINTFGYDNLFDDKIIKREEIIKNIKRNDLQKKYISICKTFGVAPKQWKDNLRSILDKFNPFIKEVYGASVCCVGRDRTSKNKYKIKHTCYNELFDKDNQPKITYPLEYDYGELFD